MTVDAATPHDAACWSCAAPAPAARLAVETVLRGRPADEGGPYRVFRCPGCGVENGVVSGPAGWMLHPLSGLAPRSVLDRFLSSAERRRLERSRVWWRLHRDDVERFRRGETPPAAQPRPRRDVGCVAATGPRAVLGVGADATVDEVRRAFRRLAKRHHPDRAGDAPDEGRFREIRAAYETLLRELGD